MSIPSLSELLKQYQGSTWFLRVHPNRSKASSYMWVAVRVMDVRFVYGKLQMLVTPSEGDMCVWVDKDKLHDSISTDGELDDGEVTSETTGA